MSIALPVRVGVPATRALAHTDIASLDDLVTRNESDVAAIHGMGPYARRPVARAVEVVSPRRNARADCSVLVRRADAYLGPYGWIGIDLDERTDWTEIAELLDASYRFTATKRNIAELDANA